jgi:hypothetical protein
MARPSIALIDALRVTATRLAAGAIYQWGHFGQCNCGHLVQTVCRLSPSAIQAWASERGGDWGELANEYCPASGLPLDLVMEQLLGAGLDARDLEHLEELDAPDVVARLGRWPSRNVRDDAVAYLRAWASLIEEQLAVRAVA